MALNRFGTGSSFSGNSSFGTLGQGGLFGNSGNTLGNSGNQSSSNQLFGSSNTGGFGQSSGFSTSTNTGFGTFGSNTGNAFGQNPQQGSSFGMGSSPFGGTGQTFGSSSQTIGSGSQGGAFGTLNSGNYNFGSTSSIGSFQTPQSPFSQNIAGSSPLGTGSPFGSTGQGGTASSLTLQWQPVPAPEERSGQKLQIQLYSISSMAQMGNASVEEIRYNDYQQKSGGTGVGMQTISTGGTNFSFGASPSTFGSTAFSTGSTNSFGQPQNSNNSSGLFGGSANARQGFGQSGNTSAFGQSNTTNLFQSGSSSGPNQPSGSTGSIFGQGNALGQGATNTNSAFGSQTASFGQTQSNAFGTSTSSSFGMSGSTTFGGTTGGQGGSQFNQTPGQSNIGSGGQSTFGTGSTFGASNTSVFQAPASSPFTSSVTGFGNNATASQNTGSSFNGLTTQSQPLFGQNTQASNTFGGASQTSNLFGATSQSNAPQSLVSTTPSTTATFGQGSTPNQSGSKPLFGAPSSTSSFTFPALNAGSQPPASSAQTPNTTSSTSTPLFSSLGADKPSNGIPSSSGAVFGSTSIPKSPSLSSFGNSGNTPSNNNSLSTSNLFGNLAQTTPQQSASVAPSLGQPYTPTPNTGTPGPLASSAPASAPTKDLKVSPLSLRGNRPSTKITYKQHPKLTPRPLTKRNRAGPQMMQSLLKSPGNKIASPESNKPSGLTDENGASPLSEEKVTGYRSPLMKQSGIHTLRTPQANNVLSCSQSLSPDKFSARKDGFVFRSTPLTSAKVDDRKNNASPISETRVATEKQQEEMHESNNEASFESSPSQKEKEARVVGTSSEAPGGVNLKDKIPILSREGYTMSLNVEDIKTISDLRNVSLTIYRKNYGTIKWLKPVDVVGMNLDEIIAIDRKVMVYPDESAKPEIGQGLNSPAIVTLQNQYNRKSGRPYKDIESMKKTFANQGARFVYYKPDQNGGEIQFEVDHFSGYGLDDEFDDIDAASFEIIDHEEIMEGSDDEVDMASLESEFQQSPARLAIDRNSLERYRHILNPSEDRPQNDIPKSLPSQDERPAKMLVQYGEHFSPQYKEQHERMDNLQGAVEFYKFNIPFELLPQPDKRILDGQVHEIDAAYLLGQSTRTGWAPEGIFAHLQPGSRHTSVVERGRVPYTISDKDRFDYRNLLEIHFHHSSIKNTTAVEARDTYPLWTLDCSSYSLKNICKEFVNEIEKHQNGNDQPWELEEKLAQYKRIWTLMPILFGDLESSAVHQNKMDEEGAARTAYLSDMIERNIGESKRKAMFSKWLEEELKPESSRRIEESQNLMEETFWLLICNDSSAAVNTAIQDGKPRLAVAISTVLSAGTAMQLMEDQLQEWESTNSGSKEFWHEMVWRLLAGDIITIYQKIRTKYPRKALKWKQVLGTVLWYSQNKNSDSFTVEICSIKDLVHSFREELLSHGILHEPGGIQLLPPYCESRAMETFPLDILWTLLSLYPTAQNIDDILVALLPASFSSNINDVSMSWLLYSVLTSIGVIDKSAEVQTKIAQLQISFLHQLQSVGSLTWEAYVALNLDDQSWINRHVTVEKVLQRNSSKLAHNMDMEDELMKKLRIPRKRLALIQSEYAHYKGEYHEEFECCRTGQAWNQAHNLFVSSLGPSIFDANNMQTLKETVVRLRNNLDQMHDQLEDIPYLSGCQVFEKYLDFVNSHNLSAKVRIGQEIFARLRQSDCSHWKAIASRCIPGEDSIADIVAQRLVTEVVDLLLGETYQDSNQVDELMFRELSDSLIHAPSQSSSRSASLFTATNLFVSILSHD